MLVDYRAKLEPSYIKHIDAVKEALKAIEPQAEIFLQDHLKNRRRWYPHEVLPWGLAKDFNELPWTPAQAQLDPAVVMSLETNLLTEDNLPYYHATIERMMDKGSVWERWNKLWTAEEANHADVMRDYLYMSRAMNPIEIEDNRYTMMQSGFDREFYDPLEIFTYTSAQELATRISHIRAGQKSDEPVALKIMTLISRDENFHYIFYRSVINEVLQIAPNLALPAIMRQFYSFKMPGTGMTNFELRQATIADAGIYGAREHRDLVMKPLIAYWKLDTLTGLNEEGEKARDRILRLEKVLTRMVDKQESTQKKTD